MWQSYQLLNRKKNSTKHVRLVDIEHKVHKRTAQKPHKQIKKWLSNCSIQSNTDIKIQFLPHNYSP